MKLNKAIFKTKKGILLTAVGVTALFLLIAFSSPSCSTTYKGRVIDAETKQPIGGAVVVASWSGDRGTLTGGTSRLEDVKEVLTDKNGEWSIKGARGTDLQFYTLLTFLTGTYYTRPPLFIIFKPGYCAWPNGFGIDACKGMIPRGHDKVADGETVELPRLTKREDRRRQKPGLIYDGKNVFKKQINFIRLLDEEDTYLYPGLQEKSMYKELLKEFNHEK